MVLGTEKKNQNARKKFNNQHLLYGPFIRYRGFRQAAATFDFQNGC